MHGAVESDPEPVTTTVVVIAGGLRYEVDGSPSDTEATIVGASRGSILQLAWLTEADSGRALALNPHHVVALEPG